MPDPARPRHQRATPVHLPRDLPRWKTILGWLTSVVGLGLFVASDLAAHSGVVLIPFDRHHLFGQTGGLVLAATGLVWATRPVVEAQRTRAVDYR